MMAEVYQEEKRKHSRSPLSSNGRGYITLSPKRTNKNKSSVHDRDFGFDEEKKPGHGKAIYRSEAYYGKSNQGQLPVRVERPFKEIPKFNKTDIVIKNFKEKSTSERSVSRKGKISVTRVPPKLNKIEGGNKSEIKGNIPFYEKS